jgi:hypothetical protein
VTFEAAVNLRDMDKEYLRAATRQASESGRPLLLTTQNIDGLSLDHSRTSVPRKIEKLIEFIAYCRPHPGHTINFNEDLDYPIADAFDAVEFRYLIDAAAKLNLINKLGVQHSLTPAGWASLATAQGSAIPGRCFVAMAFRSSLERPYRDGIRAAVEDDCGFNAVRMLELEHNDKICDRIVVEIRRAQFVIADFTFQRGGVYFEAGFAAALGRPVIWSCMACHFHRLHFDTRQYNHIKWETPADLRSQLASRIRGTIPGAKLI